ncbi:MAG: hypothetical protein ACRDOH_15960 [Streptosporangiaceae bacterium]
MAEPGEDLEDTGGDPVCWLDRVCPECGRLNSPRHPVTCEACGATFPVEP